MSKGKPFLRPSFDQPQFPGPFEFPEHVPSWIKRILTTLLRLSARLDVGPEGYKYFPWHTNLFTVVVAYLCGVVLLALLLVLPPGMILRWMIQKTAADYIADHGWKAGLEYCLIRGFVALMYLLGGWYGGRYLWRRHRDRLSRFAKKHLTEVTLLPVWILVLMAVSSQFAPQSNILNWLFLYPAATWFAAVWFIAGFLYAKVLDEISFERLLAPDLAPFRNRFKAHGVRLATAVGLMVVAVFAYAGSRDHYSVYEFVIFVIRESLALTFAALSLIQIQHVFLDDSALPRTWGRVAPLTVPAGPAREGVCITHWSDLHLTCPRAPKIYDDGANRVSSRKPGGNAALKQTLDEKGALLQESKILLLTGDMTDAGTADEWQAFLELMPDWLLNKTVMLPGNHDLNITDAKHTFRAEAGEFVLRKLRLIRMMAALDTVQGTRAYVCEPTGELVLLRDHLAASSDLLTEFVLNPPTALFSSPEVRRAFSVDVEGIWAGLFPMIVSVPDTEIKIILMDTNELGRSIADNAYGYVSKNSLVRFKNIIARFSANPLLVALHHHVTAPNLRLLPLSAAQIRFMVLRNAGDLLSLLPRERSLVVFHGHLHIGYRLRINDNIEVVSAPSTTLGDEFRDHRRQPQPVFSNYWVQVTENNGLKLHSESVSGDLKGSGPLKT